MRAESIDDLPTRAVPESQVLGSIVIPAYNEAAVIARCLDSLFADLAGHEIDVIVSCNGCTDGTADLVRNGPWPVTVLERVTAGKPGALRAADAATGRFPRLYLDADIRLTSAAAADVFAALRRPSALAARPPLVYDTDGASWPVRAFYRARSRTPRLLEGLWGAGVYGLSEAGRARFAEFPDVTADDLFVDQQFERTEIEIVDTDPVIVTSPRTVRSLWAVLRRTYSSNRQAAVAPPGSHRRAAGTLGEVLREGTQSVGALADACCYVALAAAARLSVRVRPPRAGSWGRDESSRSTPRPGMGRRRLFGMDFIDCDDVTPVVGAVLGRSGGGLPVVVTPNVDYIVTMRDPSNVEAAQLVTNARFTLPDGQPIVWCSRLFGRPLRARLPGSTLFPTLWREIVADRRPVHVVAPSDEVARRLQGECSHATFTVPPLFDAGDDVALERVVEECDAAIVSTSAQFVIIGISFPKQALLARRLIDRANGRGDAAAMMLLLGGALEMHVGLKRRAPRWMQRSGLEWFYRFVQEPRRLFRRYFVTDLRFARIAAAEWRAIRGTSSRSD